LDNLWDVGENYFSDRFKNADVSEETDYSQGIPVARNVETGELVRIRFDDTTRMAAFGASGSGKTVGAKAILSRVHDYGWNVVHFSDVKHDFQDISYKGGVSKKLIRETAGLAPGEEPHSVSRKIFQPKFLADEYPNGKPSYVEQFSLGFEDIEESDFKSLVDVTSDAQEQALNNLVSHLDLEDETFASILQELDHLEMDYSGSEALKGALKRSLKSLDNDNILGSRLRKDPFRYVTSWRCHTCGEYIFPDTKGDHQGHNLEERRAVLSLGLENYDKYTPDEKEKFQFYVASLMDNFIQALRQGRIEGPYVVFTDEYHEIVPRDESSPVKDKYQRMLDVSGRQNDIATLISTQRPSQIPMPGGKSRFDFIGDLDHIFISKNLNAEEWSKALNAFNFYNPSHQQKWKDKISSMNEFQFLYVNTNKHNSVEDCPVIEFLAPLWSHTG
jgi:hypothetical protein